MSMLFHFFFRPSCDPFSANQRFQIIYKSDKYKYRSCLLYDIYKYRSCLLYDIYKYRSCILYDIYKYKSCILYKYSLPLRSIHGYYRPINIYKSMY